MNKNLVLLLILFLMQGCASQSPSQLIDSELLTVVEEKLSYYLYFPEDYESESTKNFPLLLFLHGGGESGDTLTAIKKNGPPKLIVSGKQFPFLILALFAQKETFLKPYPLKWIGDSIPILKYPDIL